MKAEFFFHYYHDSPQLKLKIYKFIFLLFHQIYKLHIFKYIKNFIGKFLSIFIIYFKIQNLNIYLIIYFFLRGTYLFVFWIIK